MNTVEWDVVEDNYQWHETFFSPQALRDHQAKGICPLYWKIFEYAERIGILDRNDTIFDPMCGIGTTLILANLKGYASIGNELEYKYYRDMMGYEIEHEFDPSYLFGNSIIHAHVDGNIEAFLKKTERYFHPIYVINKDDSKLTVDDVGVYSGKLVVITSPPYNRTAEHDQKQVDSMSKNGYSGGRPAGYEDPNNIAMMKDKDYQRAMRKVWGNMANLNVAYIITVTRDHIDKGRVYYLSRITASLIKYSGYIKVAHVKAKIPYMSIFKRINYENHHKAKGLPLIDYEDVQFFIRK